MPGVRKLQQIGNQARHNEHLTNIPMKHFWCNETIFQLTIESLAKQQTKGKERMRMRDKWR